jgi:hypothetical protein
MRNIFNHCNRKNSSDKVGDVRTRQGPKTTLENYLEYYKELDFPGYAVLVTGPWGVGKTYQVKRSLPNAETYYVSLYGVDTIGGIHDAVLAAALPSLTSNKYLKEVGKALSKLFDNWAPGVSSGALNMVLRAKLKSDRTIIFDDLERSPLWEAQKSGLLGAINHYVEHLGFRVIAICHEGRIADQLAEIKEKTFGHTIRVESQIEEAFDYFLANDVKNENEKAFIAERKYLIEEVWRQSNQSSLRILRHVLNDVARLRRIWNERHLKKNAAVEHVLKLFCELDIEVRAGNLTKDDLVSRIELNIPSQRINKKHADNTDANPFEEISLRYSSCNPTSQTLSNEILVSTLIDGKYDPDMLAACLDQSSYYAEKIQIPPWRILMDFETLDDAILEEGIGRMQKQFDDRSVTDVGEFLHIAALRLVMLKYSDNTDKMTEEKSRCIAYIDDLLATGRLPPTSLESMNMPSDHYRGYTFWVPPCTEEHFEEIRKHIIDAQKKAVSALYPSHVKEILRMLKEDQESLLKTISNTFTQSSIFAYFPILASIPVNQFVDAWLSGPRKGWRQVTIALENRYRTIKINPELKSEANWANSLLKEIDARINSETGFRALRLSQIKPNIFTDQKSDS